MAKRLQTPGASGGWTQPRLVTRGMCAVRLSDTLHMSDRTDKASLRDLLDELLSLTDTGLRTVATAEQLAVTHAWFVRSVDMIRAALQLHDNGLGSAAHPLVRSAMEHAVGMLWLRETGEEGLGGLSNAHRQWAKNIRDAIALANTEEIQPGRRDWSPELDEVIARIEEQEQEPDIPGAWNFTKRFRIAKQFDLYVAWLSETASSHATQASATPYLQFSSDRVHLLRSPREPDTAALLNRCAVVALVAFRAMGEALTSDFWRAHVDRLEAAFIEVFQRSRSERLADKPSNDWLERFDRV